jgi:hypothetical protein
MVNGIASAHPCEPFSRGDFFVSGGLFFHFDDFGAPRRQQQSPPGMGAADSSAPDLTLEAADQAGAKPVAATLADRRCRPPTLARHSDWLTDMSEQFQTRAVTYLR